MNYLAAAVVALLSLITGAAFSETAADSLTIIATIGNTQIQYNQWKDRYEDYLVYTGVKDNKRARFAILNNMINEILLRQYDDNSKVYGNPEYKKELSWAWKESVLAFLKDQEVYAKITVTDEELRNAYQHSKAKLAVRHLYASTESEAENLYKLVKIGVSFKELAQQVFTDTALKNNGGYLGYISWGDTDPNFENAAYALKVGEVSRPVKTAEGYSIIKVEDRIDDPFTTENEFVNRRHKLERAIRIDKKIPYEKAYLARIFDTSQVTFDEKALRGVYDDLFNAGGQRAESNRRSGEKSSWCARYEDRKYTTKEIESKLIDAPEYSRNLITDMKRLKGSVMGLLMQDVLLDAAKEKGYDTTSYVKETYDNLANNIYLAYKKNEILDVVPVADSEITKYYSQNIEYYTDEPEMNVQEIVVGSDSLASALKEEIAQGKEDFGSLAAKYSQRKWSAANNGVMGLSPASKFGDLKDTLWNSTPGAIVGPLRFDKYVGIFRVLEKKDGEPIPLSEVREQITKAIKNQKGFPYMRRHLEELSKLTTIKVNDELIKNYTMKLAG